MSSEEHIRRLQERFDSAVESDPILWRHPLAEATVDLLARGKAVTIESLIERLEAGFDPADVILRRRSLEAAIERLRKIVQP